MGQKVNPHGFRVGVIKDWDSRWFVKNSEFGKTLLSDYNLRKYLKKTLFDAKVPKIEIERDNQRVKVIIHCAMPGKVIGRGGSDIEKLKNETCKILQRPSGEVSVNVVEVKYPDLNAQLVAENIADQLEKRISFRRAMKQAIARTMKLGAKGIKIAVSGLLGGADIARTEHYHEGTIPLQTIRADIDYGQHAALTKMGLIGIKVWIYKGEVLTAVKRDSKSEADRSKARENLPQRKERPQRSGFDKDGDDKQFAARSDRGDRGGRPHGQYTPREGGDNRDNRGGRPFTPRSDGQQGGGGFNRDNQNRGDRSGGFNRGGRNNDRPSAPAVNFGNRKPGFQKNQPKRPKAEETAAAETTNNVNVNIDTTAAVDVSQTEQTGGSGDVNA